MTAKVTIASSVTWEPRTDHTSLSKPHLVFVSKHLVMYIICNIYNTLKSSVAANHWVFPMDDAQPASQMNWWGNSRISQDRRKR